MKRLHLILKLVLFNMLFFGTISCSREEAGGIPKIWQVVMYFVGISIWIFIYVSIRQWLKTLGEKIDRELGKKTDRIVERMFSKKEGAEHNKEKDVIKNQKEILQPLNSIESECQHDWFCGTCRICGETETRYDMYGHDTVCGKCRRCGKKPHFIYDILDSHKLVQCKCTVCGLEVHNWELVCVSNSREEFRCKVCGKEKIVEVDYIKYYGGARED